MTSQRRAAPRTLDMPTGEQISYMVERRRRPSFSSSGLFWLSGFKSSMEGTKASAIAHWAQAKGHECVRFDYSGHGRSPGRIEDCTVSAWLAQAEAVFDEISTGPQVLIGSSMGGWLALLLLRRHVASRRPGDLRIRGLILIAPAADMSERLMWDRFTDTVRNEIMTAGVYYRPSDYDDGPYPITRALIEDGRSHLVLDEGLDVSCPVRILQGLDDPDVPWEHAVAVAQALRGDDVTVQLIRGGDHRLSSDREILRLIHTVEQLMGEVDG